ncbi:hypothetical protein [Kutzneria chonburiensis]|uniref:Uncharacterized protein n=1 Tax=Kutzneria chonburiensis TaxID=1483604 RepID=A0ABV6MU48_9PSEU|nr:hypothetical protein [Kutzneria chonburiensis]
MRFRALLIIVLLALGGCTVGIEIQVPGQALSAPTTAAPPRETATPEAAAPRHQVQVRLFVADKYHTSALLESNTRMDGIHDSATAKAAWQDPALATDPAAQKHAADTMNCFQDNPMRGEDDPKLPLAACAPDYKVAVLAPTLLTADQIAEISYGVSDDPAQGGTVWVRLTPAGSRTVAEMAPKNNDVLLALLLDGRVVSSLTVTPTLSDTLAFRFPTTSEAGQTARALVNH